MSRGNLSLLNCTVQRNKKTNIIENWTLFWDRMNLLANQNVTVSSGTRPFSCWNLWGWDLWSDLRWRYAEGLSGHEFVIFLFFLSIFWLFHEVQFVVRWLFYRCFWFVLHRNFWFIKHPLMKCVGMWSAKHIHWQDCQNMKNVAQQFKCLNCFALKYIQAITVLYSVNISNSFCFSYLQNLQMKALKHDHISWQTIFWWNLLIILKTPREHLQTSDFCCHVMSLCRLSWTLSTHTGSICPLSGW